MLIIIRFGEPRGWSGFPEATRQLLQGTMLIIIINNDDKTASSEIHVAPRIVVH